MSYKSNFKTLKHVKLNGTFNSSNFFFFFFAKINVNDINDFKLVILIVNIYKLDFKIFKPFETL